MNKCRSYVNANVWIAAVQAEGDLLQRVQSVLFSKQ